MSFRRLPCLLATCALLSACRGTPTAEVPKKAASAKPEAAVTVPPSTAPVVPAAASGALRQPAGAVRAVSGTVKLDAGYALLKGGAKIVASNGAGTLQLGEAGLIANNGTNFILSDGNRIISENGGGIISENGGGIVSSNGAGLTGKVKYAGAIGQGPYGLLESAPDQGYGSLLRAAGLAVGVVDLASGKLVKLGEDAQGRPAFGVVTDANGAYRVYLPADLASTVRVVSLPRDGNDPRLGSSLLASDLGGALDLDEDSQQVANNLRLKLAKETLHTFDPPPGEVFVDDVYLSAIDQVGRDEYLAAQQRLTAAFKAAGGPTLDDATKLSIALRLTDMALAPVKLEQLRSAATQPVPIKGAVRPAEPGVALADIQDVLRQLRVKVGEVMEAERQAGRDPEAYFAAKPYLRDAAQPWPIRKPADFDDYIIRGILADPKGDSLTSGLAFVNVLADPDYNIGPTALDTFLRANVAVQVATIHAAYGKDSPVLPAMEAELTRLVKLARPS